MSVFHLRAAAQPYPGENAPTSFSADRSAERSGVAMMIMAIVELTFNKRFAGRSCHRTSACYSSF